MVPSEALCVFLLFVGLLSSSRESREGEQEPRAESTAADPGEPLFLTPYIENGQIDLAKRLSRVGTLRGTNVPSFAGYFTVNKVTRSNMFFWFFPALVSSGQS